MDLKRIDSRLNSIKLKNNELTKNQKALHDYENVIYLNSREP